MIRVKRSLSQIMLAVILVFVFMVGCKKEDNSSFSPIIYDADSNIYHSVKIGNQEWLVENLKTKHYRNGDPITTKNGNGWGAYYTYNVNEVKIYGRLYNWHAIADPRQIAPVGWHIPSENEWNTLIKYLTFTGYGYGGIGNDIAKSISSPTTWDTCNIEGTVGNNPINNNLSGFTAFPGGERSMGYWSYVNLNKCSNWWSSSEVSEDNAIAYKVCFDDRFLVKISQTKAVGYSVRCIKD